MNQPSIFKDFAKYVSLNVLGTIGLSCYILADTFFIAQGLGADGLTALNLAIPVYSFIYGTGLMFGVGGATRYSVLRSGGARREADAVFTNTVGAVLAASALFVLLGLFGAGTLTGLLGAEGHVFEMTEVYLRVILLFAPAFMLNNVMISFVRNDGNPRLAMLAMLAGSFSNILLDYVFIFPMDLGIFGAVLATGFAPVISMMVLSVHRSREDHFRFVGRGEVGGAHGSASIIGRVMTLGVPSLITEVASGVVMIVFNFLILDLRGNVGVAAYGVIANLALVVSAVYTGIAQGMQPLVSRALGQGDRGSIGRLLRYAMVVMAAISAVIYGVFFVYAEPIVAVFNSEGLAELQTMAETGLKLYFTSNPVVGFNIILSMFFIAIERPLPAQAISVLRGAVVIIPMAFLLAAAAGITGVWLALPATELLVAVVGLGFLVCKK